jgi:hypothetical protein
MTDPQPIDIGYGDFRRATALLTHYVSNDRAGVMAVIEEAEDADRMRALVWALPAVMTGIQDGWTADAVAPVLRAVVTHFAQGESV